MRKLIIGCGYLGRRVARAWLDAGHEVSALTRSAHNAGELAGQGIDPVIGDVMDPATLTALPAADTVLYAVGLDRRAGFSQRQVYVDGLKHVLSEIAARTGRFLYVSSTSVYGQDAGEWIDESSATQPVAANGQICLEAEQVVWRSFGAPSLAATDKLVVGANVLRLAGIYGPGRLVARVDALRNAEPIHGNPEAYLNLIHVDDAAATVLACERIGKLGETYLVSDDRPNTRRDYYNALAQRIDAPPPRFDVTNLAEPERLGLNKRCSNRKIREELGVALQFPTIDQGVPHALQAAAD